MHDLRLTLAAVLLAIAAGCTSPAVKKAKDDRVYTHEAKYRLSVPGGVVITIYDSPCRMENPPSNAPYRATWEERGKVFEGCVAAQQTRPTMFDFAAQFSDRALSCMPAEAFEPLQSM